jgi:zinc-ribbon domain
MALIRCPECKREISDQATACPECGYPLPGRNAAFPGWLPFGTRPMEYKSKRTIFGLPLVHIVYGPAWMNGFRPAKGFIAIGNIAVGVIAIGGFAAGIFTLAGIGLGLFCFAGIALGIALGIGGIATGYLAIGGLAFGVYAVGGMAIGAHTLLGDPQLRESLRKIFRF